MAARLDVLFQAWAELQAAVARLEQDVAEEPDQELKILLEELLGGFKEALVRAERELDLFSRHN